MAEQLHLTPEINAALHHALLLSTTPVPAPGIYTPLQAHARATVEAEGREEWPEGLVEAVARAMGMTIYARDGELAQIIVDRCWRDWVPEATAALSAIRAWEGRE